MSNSDNNSERYVPGKFEWAVLVLDLLLFLLLSWRLVDPLFLDGQLLPSMALALLPGTLLTLLRKPAISTHRFCFALGLLVFLVVNGTINLSDIKEALARWEWVALGIAIMCFQIITGAWRWVLILQGQGIGLAFSTSLRLLTTGYFFNTFIPGSTGGDFYRIYTVAKGNKKLIAPVTTSVFLDRFLGLPTLLILVLAGVFMNIEFIRSTSQFLTIAKGYVVLALGCVLFFAALFLASFYLADRLRSYNFKGLLGRALLQAVESIEVYKDNKKILFYVLLISILSHLGTLLSFICFSKAVGLEGVHLSLMLFLVFAGIMVNYIPLAPGGAGQGELAFAWIFSLATPAFPENAHRAAVMMLCFRLGMFFYGAIGGVIYGVRHEEISLDAESEPEVESTL